MSDQPPEQPSSPPPGSGQQQGAPPPGWGQQPPPPPGWSQQPPPPPPPGWGQQPPPGWAPQPVYNPYAYAQPKTDGTAITALVLAIGSFVVCPVIPSIIALVLASSADRNIAASNGALTGESLTKAARIIAWVNLAVAALVFVLILAFVGFGSAGAGY